MQMYGCGAVEVNNLGGLGVYSLMQEKFEVLGCMYSETSLIHHNGESQFHGGLAGFVD